MIITSDIGATTTSIFYFCGICGAGCERDEVIICNTCNKYICDLHSYDNETCWQCKNLELGILDIENH